MKKTALLLAALLLLIPAVAGARELFDMRLGFTGMYVAPTVSVNGEEPDGFFEGIKEGENWGFGGELSMRLSVVRLSATLFSTQLQPGQLDRTQMSEAGLSVPGSSTGGIRMLATLGLSLPIINNYLDLELGTGLGMRFMLPKTGEAYCAFPDYDSGGYVGIPMSSVSFVDVLTKSPWHFRIGLDLTVGPFGIGAYYLMETKASVEGFDAAGGWSRLFQQNTGSLGVGITLSLF